MKGGCNCGAVTFELSGEIRNVYVCHCAICRKWTGSSAVSVVVVPNKAFRWRSGEAQIRQWKKPDADWQSVFCATCGSALPGANDASSMFVPAGLLPPSETRLRIAAHIFTGSKAPWDEIGGTAPQYQGHIAAET